MASKELGGKLRELRDSKGFTQQQVADELGLKNKSTLGSWEIGKSEPDAFTFLKLCKLYGVDNILGVFGDETPTPKKTDIHLTDQEREIILRYRKSDTIDKQIVLRALGMDEKGDNEKKWHKLPQETPPNFPRGKCYKT